ncbi:hypothetical protein R6Z02_12680 [Carnobacterium maltaromaticum]|uniref:hypothetical protein n=1 Tax=Carnobacterium maltaromaticum TaxID=2751 RepID=UPI00298A398B|nr:hypothetical protein [Carnobacterium maltaromaticum]MDW5524606.1 hypothetical protein [Carnobacterium maltaromaticum]
MTEVKNKEWINKQIEQHLLETEGEEYTGYEAGIEFVQLLIEETRAELNEDQKIVLDWLKSKCLHSSLSDIISELAFLNCTGGKIRYKLVSAAWISLNEYKQLEVLQAFAEWGLSDK